MEDAFRLVFFLGDRLLSAFRVLRRNDAINDLEPADLSFGSHPFDCSWTFIKPPVLLTSHSMFVGASAFPQVGATFFIPKLSSMEIIKLTSDNVLLHIGADMIARLRNTVLSAMSDHFHLLEEHTLTGGFGVDELHLRDGRILKGWLEFEIDKVELDGKSFTRIIFEKVWLYSGEMPDEVLDRFTVVKERLQFRIM